MSTYYFDCIEGQVEHTDTYGLELADTREAADHAACLVGTMLGERLEAVGTRAITVIVRTSDGRPLYVAHGSFHGHLTSVKRDQEAAILMPRPEEPSSNGCTPASA